jgi:hypothetical protein
MNMPFTGEQFLEVFRRYNQAIWPMQAILVALAIVAIIAAVSGGRRASRLLSFILGVLWLWSGAAYHLTFFREINPMATVFAIAFIVEAVLFVWLGTVRGSLNFDVRSGGSGITGGAIVAYSLIAYPLIGLALGHKLPSAPTFGVPCPTTIFTFGFIVWMTPRRSRAIMIVPALWSLVAFSAATQFGMWEDLGLTAAAVIAVAATVWPLHKRPSALAPRAV